MPMKPMLATDKVAPEDLSYPVIAQPKLDGIRATIQDGVVLSRTLKLIPNLDIQAALGKPEFEGLDGEIIVGDILAEDAYRKTTSFVMAPNKTGENWVFHVFDVLGSTQSAAQRNITVERRCAEAYTRRIQPVAYTFINDAAQLAEYEAEFVGKGGEGIIVRNPSAAYKHGRAGKTQQELVKIKQFVDYEAEVIGVYEEMHNGNEAKTNELGRTARSTAKAGLVGKGTLGGLVLRALNGPHEGQEFRCGTGFDRETRIALWAQAQGGCTHPLIGSVAKIKSFPIGVKDAPRFPVWLGWRDVEVDG